MLKPCKTGLKKIKNNKKNEYIREGKTLTMRMREERARAREREREREKGEGGN